MKKVGYFFFSFLPVISSVTLQFLVMFPVMGTSLIIFLLNPSTDLIDLLNFFSDTENFGMLISVLYAASGICIFGLWYQLQFKGNFTKNVKKWVNLKLFLGGICLVPTLQLATGFLIMWVSTMFPNWLKAYENLIDAAGLTQTPSFLLILYAVILGPISEELTFRGVTMASAKRALPFWAANLLQALLFGAFHMNIIQGIYAFFIGLVFGIICEKTGCIWYSIVMHMGFNFWGVFEAGFLSDTTSPLVICILYLVFIFLGILGLWLVAHNLPSKEKFTSFPKESSHSTDIYYK